MGQPCFPCFSGGRTLWLILRFELRTVVFPRLRKHTMFCAHNSCGSMSPNSSQQLKTVRKASHLGITLEQNTVSEGSTGLVS